MARSIGNIIADSLKLSVGYAERLLTGVPAARFARFARCGGEVVESNHPAFVYGHLSLYAPRILQQLGHPAPSVPEHFQHLFFTDIDRTLRNHVTFGVPSGRSNPQVQRGLVGLVGVEVHLAELGGRTKAQRQDACGQRVQGSGMTRFFRAQQPLGFLQSLVTGQTYRLVQQQHPMHRAPLHPGA